MEKIHIFHLNDVHAHLDKWPEIVSYLKERRAYFTKKKESFFVFDLGDAVDRAHPLIEATNGQAMIHLLNQAGIDAVTIGNNEGIGQTKQELNHLYKEANFKVIVSNLKERDTKEYPDWAIPFHVLHTQEGQKIGLLAVTVPLNMSYVPLGWKVEDPTEVVSTLLNEYKESVDAFLLLSHVGLPFDRRIADACPELDVVIGAHTHHLLPRGERRGNALLAAAGKFGEYIGEITLEMENGKVLSARAEVQAASELPASNQTGKARLSYEKMGRDLLSKKKVAFLEKNIESDWSQCKEIVKVSLSALQEYAHTEAAFLNAGLFMNGFQSGIVTRNELHEAMPHPMRIVRVTLSGKNLLSFLEEVEEKRSYLEQLEVEGIGFRGKKIGKLCFSGIHYEKKNKRWEWHDQKILEGKAYTFATVDHFVFATYFPILNQNTQNQILFPSFLRDVLGQYLKEKYPIK